MGHAALGIAAYRILSVSGQAGAQVGGHQAIPSPAVGPKRAADGAILDCNGEKIPGLYAAGEFGSVWGYLYQGNGNVGEAMAFGRISARSCLA